MATLTMQQILNQYAQVSYIDPGAGSLFLQVLLGGAAGISFVGKVYWRQIKEFFSASPKK